jgi:hypothetical protein
MSERLWLGLGRYMLPVPALIWRRRIRQRSDHTRASLAFMTEEHHLVREYVVTALPREGRPLAPEKIANDLHLSSERVVAILDDLEAHLTFVCRDDDGSVAWAYPVTVETTPHHVTFSSGEKLYAA